jgi:monoterpene epsilon-lactone hydrolase
MVSYLIFYERRPISFCTSIGYSGIECHLSQLFNVTILHVEYHLSPEHPMPAAVEDTVAIYRALLRQNISPSQLFIMGDSAGGGLSLLTIQALIARQLPIPRGVIAVSPWTDLSASGESYSRNAATDVMLNTDDVKWLTPAVLGLDNSKLSFDNPLISPLFGSFEGFPPMYVTVGTAEILEDDSTQVIKKAREAGVDVVFEEGLHLMHVYPVFFPYFPEARNSLDNINKWIQTIFTEKDNE